jgi:HK97 family phage prohead protease
VTETKALRGVEVKSAQEGRALVKFAAYDEIDHHSDVTVKGAFRDGQRIVVSAYNHQSWGGALPVGKGTIRTSADGKSAVGDLQFFMSTEAGRETFETVKELGDLQQWSYGFDVVDSELGEFEGKSVRFLKEVNVHEISPVLVGAGKTTATLAVKSREGVVEEYDLDEIQEWLKAKPKPKPKPGEKDEDEGKKKPNGDSKKPKDDEEDEEEDDEDKKKPQRKKPGNSGKMRMSDHCLSVLTEVKELADRAEEIVVLRKADGKKGLAPDTQVLLELVGEQLKRLDSLVRSSDPTTHDAEIARAFKNLSEEI